ncbi:neuraminidase-like domain-containing protein, partial [Bacillus cereus]|uniref:neuraminidase-like domain-containing protein n=1 Tax=Bacillus cereus TaxID=1396 RepID=UPI000C01C55E
MSHSTVLQSIKEARRDVLVDHYIANNIPEELEGKVTDAVSLYEYLLLDTKISDLVKTSPVAEAISSVQLYINRCIEGYEGELTTKSKNYFAPEKFLYNWDAYNKRYATWAGKERLKYYAGSYIDPSLRYNKTDLFKNLEQRISQGRFKEDSVQKVVKNYLNKYQVLTNLEYISVNTGDDESTLFFVGRTKTIPYEYFWRRLTLKKNMKNKLVPSIWSEWKKINATIGEAVDNNVIPYWKKNRLHIRWSTVEKIQNDDGTTQNKTYINDWMLDTSGSWSSYEKFPNYSNNGYYEQFVMVDKTIQSEYIDLSKGGIHCDVPGLFSVQITVTPARRVEFDYNSKYLINKPLFISHVNDEQEKTENITLNRGNKRSIAPPSNSNSTVLVMFEKNSVKDNLFFEFKYINRLSPSSYGTIHDDIFSPPSGSNISGPIYLSVVNKKIDLCALLEKGLDTLFDYQVQNRRNAFYGPYGIYLWEIFF